jgi:flagellar biosynthesis/type III secretory pathway ATPase
MVRGYKRVPLPPARMIPFMAVSFQIIFGVAGGVLVAIGTQTTRTNSQGFYTISNLETSRGYSVAASLEGFLTESVSVTLSGNMTVNITLKKEATASLIGRVVDPLGRPLDGKGPIRTEKTRAVEKVAPDVAKRSPVNTPVMTGIKAFRKAWRMTICLVVMPLASAVRI